MLDYLEALRQSPLTDQLGFVRTLSAKSLTSRGPDVAIGELCDVMVRQGAAPIRAEVIGMSAGAVTLLPYGDLSGVKLGDRVRALGTLANAPMGQGLIGRVIDGWGRPIDNKSELRNVGMVSLKGSVPTPMSRPRVNRLFETKVRAVDALLPIGEGQRMGIFAGSGVGKSTLLGMMAQSSTADISVIALVGERGREVKDFIETHLGNDGMARSVVVVATSDEPAVLRLRATHYAIAIAEYFRDQGLKVLLTVDSITRYAMARREVGLLAGEPPTARGYTPSVFVDIPQLCERCGTHPNGGSITALMTVLVDGDDFNEPISDCLRATLDGHIVLSRDLAHAGQFPAIDILRSTSRLASQLLSAKEQGLVNCARSSLALVDKNQAMVHLGAYVAGSNPTLDVALKTDAALKDFLRQVPGEISDRQSSLARLQMVMQAWESNNVS